MQREEDFIKDLTSAIAGIATSKIREHLKENFGEDALKSLLLLLEENSSLRAKIRQLESELAAAKTERSWPRHILPQVTWPLSEPWLDTKTTGVPGRYEVGDFPEPLRSKSLKYLTEGTE